MTTEEHKEAVRVLSISGLTIKEAGLALRLRQKQMKNSKKKKMLLDFLQFLNKKELLQDRFWGPEGFVKQFLKEQRNDTKKR